MSYVKNSSFSEYKFARRKTQFFKAKQEKNVESDRSE